MKELVCNYALVRFMPYRETGEFVNVGVVVYAPEVNHFDYRLTDKRYRRVKAFFPELNVEIYVASVESLANELDRRKAQFRAMAGLFGGDRAVGEGLTAFRSMLRRRESLLNFTEPGMRLGTPPETLDALYADYVMRSFAQTPAYHETVMRNRLNGLLKQWGLRKRYKRNRRVGDEMFNLLLPFVHYEGESAVVAIKPVDLDRPKPTDVYDHGGIWVQRFRRLAERGGLPPRMIVPVQLPTGPGRAAAEQIARELNEIHVECPDVNDVTRIHNLVSI